MKLKNYLVVPACMFLAFSALAATELTTVVQDAHCRDILADSFSRTLYVFDPDQNQQTPVCDGTCAELWPPYLLTNDEAAAVQAPLGKIVRKNGKTQLTYDGRPVYTWAYDRAKSDETGDNVGMVWHIIEVPKR